MLIRKLLQHMPAGQIAVCCPTGKAAVRITEALQRYSITLTATTIHQALEVDGKGRKVHPCTDGSRRGPFEGAPLMSLHKLASCHAHKILAKLIDLGAIAGPPLTGVARDEEHHLQVVVTIARYEGPMRIDPETLRKIEAMKEPPFIANAVQKAILQALDGKAMRSTTLADIVGDRARLFRKPGGIQELRERGLVDWHKRLGYYRPDAKPKELL